ncbi:hypothetical protein HMI55_000065 [Coelomomyces lativittatus]|nr:hypothetical protein HMI56_006640 [Coelomomyces lativittatus]KAJ1517323.1 hypothetical protein HMI55_000065 [Coelomomyces lativittatus]
MPHRFWTTLFFLLTLPFWCFMMVVIVGLGVGMTVLSLVLFVGTLFVLSVPFLVSNTCGWIGSFLHGCMQTFKWKCAGYLASCNFKTSLTKGFKKKKKKKRSTLTHFSPWSYTVRELSSSSTLVAEGKKRTLGPSGYSLNHHARPVPFITDPFQRPFGLSSPVSHVSNDRISPPPYSHLSEPLKEALYRGYGASMTKDEATLRFQIRQGLHVIQQRTPPFHVWEPMANKKTPVDLASWKSMEVSSLGGLT